MSLQVAIKSIRKEKIKDEQDLVHIRREIEIMSTLCHPHIITIYEGKPHSDPPPRVCLCQTRYLEKDASQSVFVWDSEFGHAKSLC